jgi:hypothetical protein
VLSGCAEPQPFVHPNSVISMSALELMLIDPADNAAQCVGLSAEILSEVSSHPQLMAFNRLSIVVSTQSRKFPAGSHRDQRYPSVTEREGVPSDSRLVCRLSPSHPSGDREHSRKHQALHVTHLSSDIVHLFRLMMQVHYSRVIHGLHHFVETSKILGTTNIAGWS